MLNLLHFVDEGGNEEYVVFSTGRDPDDDFRDSTFKLIGKYPLPELPDSMPTDVVLRRTND